MPKRYLVSYIPATEAREMEKKLNLSESDNLWELVRPDEAQVFIEAKTQRQALEAAKRLLPLDEFGTIEIYEQIKEAKGESKAWRTLRCAHYGYMGEPGGERLYFSDFVRGGLIRPPEDREPPIHTYNSGQNISNCLVAKTVL